jgi:hypothetical protein
VQLTAEDTMTNHRFGRLYRWLLYGGSFSWKALELEILRSTSSLLNPVEQHAMEGQIASVERIKRTNGGRMTTFHFGDTRAIPRFSDQSPDLLLAVCTVRGSEFVLKGNLVLHRGLLSSIEYSAEPSKALDMSACSVDVRLSSRGERSTVASELDDMEHGFGSDR